MATAREEAERLVATALAAAQFASRAAKSAQRGSSGASARDGGDSRGAGDMLEDLAGLANMASKFLGAAGFGTPPRASTASRADAPAPAPERHHVIANGSDECCVCPICRAIAAVRDPSPEFAERLATGASDLAAGATSILRAFGEAARRAGGGRAGDDRAPVVEVETLPSGAPPVADAVDDAAVGGVPVAEPDAAPENGASNSDGGWPSWGNFGNVWQAATRVQDDPLRRPDAEPASPKPVAKKAVAKKAVAKKAVAKKAVAKKAADLGQAAAGGAATPTPAKKAPARKAAPKAAAKKATAKATSAKATGTRTTGAKATNAKATNAKATGGAKTSAAKATGAKAAGAKTTGVKATKATPRKAAKKTSAE